MERTRALRAQDWKILEDALAAASTLLAQFKAGFQAVG
jgi:hypothetical protein